MLPRVSNVLAARHHLQARQVEQLERLGGELRVAVHKSAADEENNRSSQVEGSAPETYSADKTDKGKVNYIAELSIDVCAHIEFERTLQNACRSSPRRWNLYSLFAAEIIPAATRCRPSLI